MKTLTLKNLKWAMDSRLPRTDLRLLPVLNQSPRRYQEDSKLPISSSYENGERLRTLLRTKRRRKIRDRKNFTKFYRRRSRECAVSWDQIVHTMSLRSVEADQALEVRKRRCWVKKKEERSAKLEESISLSMLLTLKV
jgi:hypothetical protein